MKPKHLRHVPTGTPWGDRAFYESAEWAELSRRCKERDSYRCRKCGYQPPNKKLRWKIHADHIVSRSKGGRDRLPNLQSLCVECHRKKHPHMQKKGKGKPTLRSSTKGTGKLCSPSQIARPARSLLAASRSRGSVRPSSTSSRRKF